MDLALVLEWVIKSLVVIFMLLGGFAYLTWFERRILARMQTRVGPNRAGWQGLLQPVADAVKLVFKEELIPARADKVIFVLAPILTVVPATVLAVVIPFGTQVILFGRQVNLAVADINVGILFLMAVASVAVYGIVLAGWSSNNKFALMGGMRSTAQMISYELALGLSFVLVALMADSLQLSEIVEAQRTMWFVVLQPVGAIVFLIVTLAEVNRAPFDMPEAEQELAAGFHSEYSGMKFALFFMAEYQKMIVISIIAVTLFFGGYLGPFIGRFPWLGPVYVLGKVVALLFGMVWIRATLPRIRYDRLMDLGWKVLLPLVLGLVLITATGILLADEFGNSLVWSIPVVSILAGFLTVGLVDRSLRRKFNALR
ncbi:MAG: NADH-quinone oxidoreductase subunit NuoH [Anaerolineales bacterium]|nr:NADH-quinone oxidoreductase subunit NuoH [Anaerolineales bacterium]